MAKYKLKDVLVDDTDTYRSYVLTRGNGKRWLIEKESTPDADTITRTFKKGVGNLATVWEAVTTATDFEDEIAFDGDFF